MALVGIIGTAHEWNRMITERFYYPLNTVVLPMLAVVGLGLLASPDYLQPQPEGENVARLSIVRLLKPRWWLILALAVVAGVVNRFLHETM